MSELSVKSKELLVFQKDIITFDDGFKYFWPEGCRGAFSAHNLRQIADELDKQNETWQKETDDYFEVKDNLDC